MPFWTKPRRDFWEVAKAAVSRGVTARSLARDAAPAASEDC